MNTYIFGFVKDGRFIPESLFLSLEDSVSSLKYWALNEEQYQVWEYPSGKIFELAANKQLDDKDDSSFPSPETWQPVFKPVEEDKSRVIELYEAIKANPSMVKRMSIRWLRPWETFFYNINSRGTKKFLAKQKSSSTV